MKNEQLERLNIQNYKLNAHYSREIFSKGGGVLLLSKPEINSKQVYIPKSLQDLILQEKQFEFCVNSFRIDALNFILVGIYRSPCSNVTVFLDRLSLLIDFLNKKFDKIIVAGDINIDIFKKSKEHIMLKNILKSHNMRYLVNFATRVTNNTKSAIDNFFVKNIPNNSISVDGIVTLLSDHDGQIMDITHSTVNTLHDHTITIECRSFTHENIDVFVKLLSNETWIDVYMAPVTEKYSVFFNSLKFIFDQAFPKKIKKKIKSKSNWLSQDLKEERKEIIQLNKNIRKTKNYTSFKVVKERHRKYKMKLFSAKKAYYDKKIANSSNVQKTVWNIINNEVGRNCKGKSDNINSVINEGRTYTNPKEICNIFNNYFVNLVKNTSTGSATHTAKNINNNSNSFVQNIKSKFSLRPVEPKEVEKVISSFKNKLSTGYDEIPVTVLKAAKYHLSPVLTHLINSSFISGYFPIELKISKIIPIHKKNDLTDIANYRPISLLPSISKIYEKIVYNQLVTYLENHELIDKIQHGFCEGKSVITATVSFIESIIESVDKGDLTIGIFMDLSKAFDSVSHPALVEKLNMLGVQKQSLDWFKSYLSDRQQFVEIKYTERNRIFNASSQLQLVKFGVPQGSILGPLLFVCYIKNIALSLSNFHQGSLCLYADDLNLKISAKTAEQVEILSSIELNNIKNFLNTHNLLLNISKTNYINFQTQQSSSKDDLNIIIETYPIELKTSTRFLGLQIDKNLNWNEHINKILTKINSGIYALAQMSYLCNLSTLKTIYYSYIHSHIAYGICLYGATKKENLDQILKQQKRAIRIIMKLSFDQSVREHFKNLKIPTVYGQYIYDTILSTRNKFLNSDTVPQHPYNTRKKSELIPNHHRLEFYTKKPSYIGAKFYKSLPDIIKKENNEQKFKQKLKDYLIDNVIYSFDEFYYLK